MEGRPYESYYSTQFNQNRMERNYGGAMSNFLQGFDGEHLAMCVVSAIVMYGAGWIIARLFFSGIMFFLSVGLIVFLVMQVVDGVDSSAHAARHFSYESTY